MKKDPALWEALAVIVLVSAILGGLVGSYMTEYFMCPSSEYRGNDDW